MQRIFCLAALLVAYAAQAATLSVTTSADNTTVDGSCSLREAITAHNAATATTDCPAVGSWGVSDTIAFAIPAATDPGCNGGTGVCTLVISGSVLPQISRAVTLDGSTQAGWSANTIPFAFPGGGAIDAALKIEIDGGGLTTGNGLIHIMASAAGSRITGLAVGNYRGPAALVAYGLVEFFGNFTGVRADGVSTTGFLNTQDLLVWDAAIGSRIGLVGVAASRNLLSQSVNVRTDDAVVAGNLVGTTRSGALMLTNPMAGGVGLYLSAGALMIVRENTIGAGAGRDGITVNGVTNLTIANNLIGVGVGSAALANAHGVRVVNEFGAPTTAVRVVDNVIANSSYDGVLVAENSNGSPSLVSIQNNSIYANAGLGINLATLAEGVYASIPTPNDPSPDADAGPNGLLNYPVITSAIVNGTGDIEISFTLDSAATATFAIAAYANSSCDASGYGEGRFPMGIATPTFTTNPAGHAAGTITIPAPLPSGWGAGQYVTLLASDAGYDASTSEFSACVQIPPAPPTGSPPVMGDVPNQAGTVGSVIGSINLAGYVTLTDGDPILSFAYTGTLPPGLNFNTVTGQISGTPTAVGTYAITVTASDDDGASNGDAVQFVIVSQFANGPVATVPTLSGTALVLLSLLLAVTSVTRLRRRARS